MRAIAIRNRDAGRTGPTRAGAAMVLAMAFVLSACTTVLTRSAVPEDQVTDAAPYGINTGLVRVWGDTIGDVEVDRIIEGRARRLETDIAAKLATARATGKPISQIALALSGGGPDGAFGAGLLNGWTARGDRPQFDIVTGISTGAIVALFAFLGPEYDDELTEVYTTYRTEQLFETTIFAALTGGTAAADARGYRRLIEQYVDEEVMRRLVEGHAEGRVLLIGTTNLDASRPVVWNVGAIAASGHPDAQRLVHDIIQASSAIPAAFPPVLIPVVGTDGRKYDEMHVDGGATEQVMLFSPEIPLTRIDRALGVEFDRSVYVVVNNKLKKPYSPVRPRILSIAGAAASSLIGGSGTGDIYKIFAITNRDGADLKVQAIPTDFDMEAQEPFDPVYMTALYELGYEIGFAGDRWLDRPPDYHPGP